ncbi:f8fbdccf-9ec4-4e22-b217-afa1ec4b0a83 [Thermothielavioides terrestris]|jgi:hypothetical protein|uniref:Uncharacterized protein n=2 Tax=Thermothielavioides terrestris TaxID=2587410 RepID=G2R8A4_THETT|nr:uncharacterized protein THITE_2170697 [Thermothielavioides terrestris NRRL 8126]AEO68163.1 hypothetical protein THITE_2170697 [Thermothielavioides terrestris NRRL 8126]SPQ24589.1 f8fbdccf-9ec4-4e22-b217-afa1ec4b0a83 [Thermothielavioides terrestris]
MGKPTASPIPGIAGSSSSDADAVSLHTQPGDRAFDDDVPELQPDDLPPLYTDIEPNAAANAPLLPNIHQPDYVTDALRDGQGLHEIDAGSTVEFFMHPRLDNEPGVLEKQIRLSAEKPPRSFVRIRGTHTQMVEEKGKREKKTVTDFDVSVELTPYLFSDATRGVSWKELRTVENQEKARRGTILRKRAPGVKRDIEITEPKPTLAEWCHRYCASHAGVKSFVLQRRVVGFDHKRMKDQLEALVRGTNYRGNVDITFPVKDNIVIVYNECRVNRWRLTPWIVWLCYLTFLWLFTWPFLFFRTKKFEVAMADWPFSVTEENGNKRYVSMSEAHIYNLWGRAISRAVLDKRQGTLDQADLIASQTDPSEPFGNILEGAPRFLREGINAITAVNRQLGWGGDSF